MQPLVKPVAGSHACLRVDEDEDLYKLRCRRAVMLGNVVHEDCQEKLASMNSIGMMFFFEKKLF